MKSIGARATLGLILGGLMLSSVTVFAQSAIKVPAGNRNAGMTSMPNDTIRRRLGGRSFDAYFIKSMNMLNDKTTLGLIQKVARIYQVDPVHILAAIVGEHTFNVTMADTAQGYTMAALTWAPKWALRFSANRVSLADLIKDPIMSNCMAQQSDYYKWECVRVTWESKLRGRSYNGVAMPAKSFRSSFFNPVSTGYTYGIGQLDPMKALMLSDVVARIGGLTPLSVDDPADVYSAIIDANRSLHYTAALVRTIADLYRNVGGFDISDNPGITATLYNVGFELQRAQKIANENRKSLTRGEVTYPQENYYGWAINSRVEDLKLLAAGKWRGVTTSSVSLDEAADRYIGPRQSKPAEEVDDGGGATTQFNIFNFGR